MRFQRNLAPDEPEINLIPLIDVLLVMLIFLTATTTFTRFSELAINLPSAASEAPPRVAELAVEINAAGRYAVDGRPTTDGHPATLAAALRDAAGGREDPMLVIYADAQAAHQKVVNVMQAAREAGITRLSFAASTTRP